MLTLYILNKTLILYGRTSFTDGIDEEKMSDDSLLTKPKLVTQKLVLYTCYTIQLMHYSHFKTHSL